ncbi:MAG: RDD family protein [Anaerolineae bacterium]
MTVQAHDKASYELAEIGTRFIAWCIDGAILFIIEGAGFYAAHNPGLSIGFIFGLAYTWFFLTRNNGQTPGMMVMKIRVLKADGSPISDSDAVLRFIGTIINFIGCIGWLWMLVDANRQGWHDKLANTYVVKTA